MNQRALLGELGIEDEEQPRNTGIAGGLDPGPVAQGPEVQNTGPLVPTSTSDPMTLAAPKPGPFQSQNATVRGYLDEAVRAFAPQVKAIKDEAGRKSAVEGYLQSLIPEVEKRGGRMSGIKGENATVDGRILDFYRDIEGAADPQVLDKTDEVNSGGMAALGGGDAGSGFGGALLDDALQGDPLAKIQQLIAQMGGSRPNLSALMQNFGGG